MRRVRIDDAPPILDDAGLPSMLGPRLEVMLSSERSERAEVARRWGERGEPLWMEAEEVVAVGEAGPDEEKAVRRRRSDGVREAKNLECIMR
jgi:hypothetical protein